MLGGQRDRTQTGGSMSGWTMAGLIAGAMCMTAACVVWCAVVVGSETEREMERWEWVQ